MSQYSQNGNSILGDIQPGERVRNAVNRVRGSGNTPDMSQTTKVVPDTPGPRVMGRSPVIGSLRRERDIPVVRDELPSLMD